METDYKGLLILLKKRRLHLSGSDTKASQFHYLIFGSFDALQIIPITRWEHQRPSFILDMEAAGIYNGEDDSGLIEQDDSKSFLLPANLGFTQIPYVGSFILRALRPSNNSSILAYPDYRLPAPDKPFCALMLINFSHSLCRSMESGQKLTEWMVQQLGGCPAVQNQSVECCLYENLGYYDVILLLRSQSPKPLEELCTYVRRLKKDGMEAVSSCYATLGLQNPENIPEELRGSFWEALEQAQTDIDKVRVSFQLQSGSQSPLADLRAESIAELNGYKDFTASIPGNRSKELFERYFFCGEMDTGTSNAAIMTTNTHVYARHDLSADAQEAAPPECGNPGTAGAPSSIFSGGFDQDFWNVYKGYVDHRQQAHRSPRLATALRQTVLRFQNLVSSDHCFDLKALATPIFKALCKNMELANDHLDALGKKVDTAGTEDEKAAYRYDIIHFWESYDIAIKDFRDMVGRYISDLSLSDTHFIEDSHLKYPSVGTATKLIFVYQYFIRELANAVVKNEEDTYRFLVKSGGRDEVCVTNIFNDLWHRDTAYGPNSSLWYLLVIDIPEKLLYDIPTALFALTHEAFHVVGNRSRRERAEYLCEAVSNFIASYLDILCFERVFLNTESYVSLYLSPSEQREIALKGSAFFRNGLRRMVFDELYPEISSLTDEQLIAVRLKNVLEENCRELLLGDFQKKILALKGESLHEGMTRFISEQSTDDYLSRYIIAERLIRDRKRIAYEAVTQPDEKTEENEEYRKEHTALKAFISCLLGYAADIPLEKEYFDDDLNYSVEYYQLYAMFNLPWALYLCMDALQEGFSDIMLIKTLNLDWCSYLIHLLSSEQSTDVDVLLPYTQKAVLRLGCVMECAFSIKGRLSETRRAELEANIRSYQLTEEVQQILDRMDQILSTYAERYGLEGDGNGIAPPICAYLKKSTNDLYAKLGTDYEQVAREMREFAAAEGIENRKAQVMNYWLRLAKEDDHGGQG